MSDHRPSPGLGGLVCKECGVDFPCEEAAAQGWVRLAEGEHVIPNCDPPMYGPLLAAIARGHVHVADLDAWFDSLPTERS